MEPTRIKNANRIYTAPTNWDVQKDGECLDLHARVISEGIESAWKPSAAELAELNAGGVVVLRVYSVSQPPVMMYVEPGD